MTLQCSWAYPIGSEKTKKIHTNAKCSSEGDRLLVKWLFLKLTNTNKTNNFVCFSTTKQK